MGPKRHSNSWLAEQALKYPIPTFLAGIVSQNQYGAWLEARSKSIARRDRKRFKRVIIAEEYKAAIHRAVYESNGIDAYTDEKLDWTLLSKYDSKAAKGQGTLYKKKFAFCPSIDHVDAESSNMEFKICAWRTNDAKSYLSYQEFLELCKKVIAVAENKGDVSN